MRIRNAVLATLAVLTPAAALAQGDTPNRKITMIVGFAPGGGVDVLARVVAQELNDNAGFQIVIENRPGAASNIAVISIDGGSSVKLFDVAPTVNASSVVWTMDGRSLVYSDTRNGVSNLWSQSLAGGPPVQLTDFRTDRIYSLDFSRDGRQLALTRGNKISNVVLFSNLK